MECIACRKAAAPLVLNTWCVNCAAAFAVEPDALDVDVDYEEGATSAVLYIDGAWQVEELKVVITGQPVEGPNGSYKPEYQAVHPDTQTVIENGDLHHCIEKGESFLVSHTAGRIRSQVSQHEQRCARNRAVEAIANDMLAAFTLPRGGFERLTRPAKGGNDDDC